MRLYLFFLIILFSGKSFSQASFTIEQCETLFQKSNLSLLAEQYNIDISKAAVIQAKIWDLPYIYGEINFLNPQDKKLFDAGNNGQKTLAIQQLIYLGGKKKNEIEFAKSNVAIAELQYEQLIRSLRFQLQQNFYELYFNQQKAKSINAQILYLDTLITSYDVQAQKGNIALKDVTRLQALTLSFKNDLLEIQKNIFNSQENLKVLTNTSSNIEAFVNEKNLDLKYGNILNYFEEQLQTKALFQNTEYLTTLKIIHSNELMLKWQKSLSLSDLTLGANYDQRGGAFNNQVNLTFGIPLPFWNKNKGNIKIAEAQIAQSKILKEQKTAELKSKISTALNTFLYLQKQYYQTISSFQNFEIVHKGMLENFQKRNISMLEFTDFMESYSNSIMFFADIRKQLVISGETLNYLTNDKVF